MTPDDVNDPSEPTAVASFATEGEADVAQAKLRAYGVDAVVEDQIEGGAVRMEGDDGVVVEVRAEDAADAVEILREEAVPLEED